MTHPKSTPMKVFQTVRKNFAAIHFRKDQRWFHLRTLFELFKPIMAIVLQCIYLFYDANTPEELMNSIFMTIVGILVFISLMSTVQKKAEIFFFMDWVQVIVNERLKHSASRTMYAKTNNLSEKLSKIIYFLMVKVSVPGFVLPKAILSFFIYCTTDAGSDAFELSIPTW